MNQKQLFTNAKIVSVARIKKNVRKQRGINGYNINKLHAKIQKERTGSYLFPVKETA